MAVSLPATVPAGATPLGPIAGAAPGSISTFLYRAYTASGAPYLFAGLPPVQPAAATATTQPATPSGTVSGAPGLTLDPGTLANLIAGIGNAAPISPGYSGDPGTSYTYDSGLNAVDSGASSSGGGPNLLLWGLVIVAAIAAYLYWKKHHHGR